MKTAWVRAWSILPKVALSKAKPPASDKAEIFRSCFLAQLMAGPKALVSNARMAGLMVRACSKNKPRIAANGAFGAMMAIKDCRKEFQYAVGAVLGAGRTARSGLFG